MNILFINYAYPIPENGGTQRSIYLISRYLYSKGHHIFVGYFEGAEGNLQHIHGILYLSDNLRYQDIKEYIIAHKISLIISFTKYCNKKIVRAAKDTKCKLISSLRYAPNDSISKISTSLNSTSYQRGIKSQIKKTVMPLYLYYIHYISKRRIQYSYNHSDLFILPAVASVLPFLQTNGILNDSKIRVINNALSFDKESTVEELEKKEKIVLIVARLAEKSKRILLALQIWHELMNSHDYHRWRLIIVGSGSDRTSYEKYILQHEIKNITMIGKQNPYKYYLESSIFMMTSAAEGFGNTLLESIQMGCVPIAFDSFPALQDIIINEKTGLVITNNDIHTFLTKLKLLMDNDELRKKMAINAIEDSKRFSIDRIGEKWISVITELFN